MKTIGRALGTLKDLRTSLFKNQVEQGDCGTIWLLNSGTRGVQ